MGIALGSYFDDMMSSKQPGGPTQGGDFAMALLVLAAAVIRADKKILKSELDYVKGFFTSQFGAAKTRESMKVLKEILKQDYSIQEVCMQIRRSMDHPSRVQLLHFLFGISNADGEVHLDEIKIIKTMAGYLGISQVDFASIKAMFVQETTGAYKILEVAKSATDAEIKKAYRKMAVKYHPDKVSHLGPEFKKSAKEKFQMLGDAYDKIKKERGMN